jgi:hypothetical protein
LNKKYAAFARHDVENWTWTRLVGNNILLLFPIRFVIAWGIGLFYGTFISIAMLGRDLEKPLPAWFNLFLKYFVKPGARLHLFLTGVVWIEKQ